MEGAELCRSGGHAVQVLATCCQIWYRSGACVSSLTGVIKEEAEQKVGGAERLRAAVEEGRVKKGVHKGMELYYFPSVELAESWKMEEKGRASKSKKTTAAGYEALSSLVGEMGWAITTPASSIAKAVEAKKPLPPEVVDKLECTTASFQRAYSAAEKVVEKLAPMEKSAVMQRNFDEMNDTMHQSVGLLSDLKTAAKFKKTASGKPVTLEELTQLQEKVAGNMQSLLDLYRVLKPLTGPAPRGAA